MQSFFIYRYIINSMCTQCRVIKEYRDVERNMAQAKKDGVSLELDVTIKLLPRNRKFSVMELEVIDRYREACQVMSRIHKEQLPHEAQPTNKKLKLTNHEQAILELYRQGNTHQEIAEKLGIKVNSIAKYITKIRIKMQFA